MSREGVEKAWLGNAADFKMGHFSSRDEKLTEP